MIIPSIEGKAHWNAAAVSPFAIGDVDRAGSFIHVLDDATLDIALSELDTVTDFTAYLTKKEAIIRSGKLLVAGGEEDIIAYYMTHMNALGEHDFTKPDGSNLGPNDYIGLSTGFYSELRKKPQYIAKKDADRNSYLWDRLIEAFTTPMLAGTTIVPDGHTHDWAKQENGVRHMALVPRFKRRFFGDAILEVVEKAKSADRFTRVFLPGPEDADQETGFFFMTLKLPSTELKGGYQQYRSARRSIMETYALVFLRRYPNLARIVGVATEPPGGSIKIGSSEDLIVAEVPEWTPKLIADLEGRAKELNVAEHGNYVEYQIQGQEFPDVPNKREQTRFSDFDTFPLLGNLNRQQRRAQSAEERRRKNRRK